MRKIIMWIVAILNAAGAAVLLALRPENRVPVHYGLDGLPDRWGSKWELLLLPLVPVLLAAGFELYWRLTRTNGKLLKNRKLEEKFASYVQVAFAAVSWVTLAGVLRGRLETDEIPIGWIFIAVGLLIMLVGNMMGKLEQNRAFGIRTKWTLENKEVWRRTHRFCGQVWAVCGLLLMADGAAGLVFSLPLAAVSAVFIALFLVIALTPFLYSWRAYKKAGAP